MFTPYALELYRRYMAGETVEQLSTETAIPPERIQLRLRAAAAYIARQREMSAAAAEGDAGPAGKAA